jgi:hypothetical protein
MEQSDYDEILLYDKVRDYWRNKADGTPNTSENGCDAWVALCAHPTHTDSDTD